MLAKTEPAQELPSEKSMDSMWDQAKYRLSDSILDVLKYTSKNRSLKGSMDDAF